MPRIIRTLLVSAALLGGVAAPALATVVNVGGGTWNYGTGYDFPASHHGWSNYYHPTSSHTGTSICGSTNHTTRAAAGSWANSSVSCGITSTISAYWNNR